MTIRTTGHSRARLCALAGALAACACLAANSEPPATDAPARVTTRPTPESPRWLCVAVDSLAVRVRPDQNSVLTTRLGRDAVLVAVEREGGFYRVLPPEGTFVYVSAAHVDRGGALREGVVKVQSGSLRVRAGSTTTRIDPAASDVIARLDPGARVEIIGEDADWLRIVPPVDVHFYVAADFVDEISPAQAVALAPEAVAAARQRLGLSSEPSTPAGPVMRTYFGILAGAPPLEPEGVGRSYVLLSPLSGQVEAYVQADPSYADSLASQVGHLVAVRGRWRTDLARRAAWLVDVRALSPAVERPRPGTLRPPAATRPAP